LLAVGGCLSPVRLENAYRHGIFPWFGEGEPILWWSPDPRMILLPAELRVSRSLRKCLRNGGFSYSFDEAFEPVLEACAAPRSDTNGTWITREIRDAYREFHRLGYAHSFECWHGGQLAGGLYGVGIGRVFYGESMFHRVSNASKAALVFAVESLQRWGYELIDCQLHTSHLESLGAREIPRKEFIRLLRSHCNRPVSPDAWRREGAPA
jgi:leucyl/phenylalanyl-tRNA--protein transferase